MYMTPHRLHAARRPAPEWASLRWPTPESPRLCLSSDKAPRASIIIQILSLSSIWQMQIGHDLYLLSYFQSRKVSLCSSHEHDGNVSNSETIVELRVLIAPEK